MVVNILGDRFASAFRILNTFRDEPVVHFEYGADIWFCTRVWAWLMLKRRRMMINEDKLVVDLELKVLCHRRNRSEVIFSEKEAAYFVYR